MRANYLFTSESVAEGHPDKVCDRISDEIVDLVYREAAKTGVDPWTVRIACETLATTNRVVIAGEVRLPPSLLKKDKNGNDVINPSKFKSAARKAIRDIGYEQDGFHWKTAKIDVLLHFQSAHIAQGVDNASDKQGEEGAGDQGIMTIKPLIILPDPVLRQVSTPVETVDADIRRLADDMLETMIAINADRGKITHPFKPGHASRKRPSSGARE